MVCRKYADYRFLSKLGDNGDLHLAGLNVKNILSSIALCKNHCAGVVFLNYEAFTGGAQKYARIEVDGRFGVQVTPFSTRRAFQVYNGDLHLAGLNVKNILSSIALCKN